LARNVVCTIAAYDITFQLLKSASLSKGNTSRSVQYAIKRKRVKTNQGASEEMPWAYETR